MSFDSDGHIDPDEALRLLDLAHAAGASQDLVLLVESKGTAVDGESTRQFDDGKKRLDALGYMFSGYTQARAGNAQNKVGMLNFSVVRQCDAATASLCSLFKSQVEDISVRVSSFKAGGDISKDAQPTLELIFDKVRIASMSILTASKLTGSCEILSFAYESLEIRSAPQLSSGMRGAVRTCTFS